jgi:hypothetical protein
MSWDAQDCNLKISFKACSMKKFGTVLFYTDFLAAVNYHSKAISLVSASSLD